MKPLCLCLLLVSAVASGHRYHQSSLFLKLAKNPDHLQAVLEIDTSDFQSVLQRASWMEDHFQLEDLKDDKEAIAGAERFLNTHLRFTQDQVNLKLEWHAVRIGAKITKVYFTLRPPSSLGSPLRFEGMQVRNTLLFDWNSNQLNYLYVDGEKRFYLTSRAKNASTVKLR